MIYGYRKEIEDATPYFVRSRPADTIPVRRGWQIRCQRALDSATQATRLPALKMEDVDNNIGLAI